MAASTSSVKDADRHVNADAEVGVANDVVPQENAEIVLDADAEVGVANDVVPQEVAEIVFDAAAIEARTWLLDFINNAGDSLPVVAKKLITELHKSYHLKLSFVWVKRYCPHCDIYINCDAHYTTHSRAHERAAKRQGRLIKAGRASFW